MLPAVQRGHRFLELDSLRGLAALAVVLQHYHNALGASSAGIYDVISRLLGSGNAAVVLFFLLSGFVLTTSYLGPRRPTYQAFLTKRVCRIYLPYAVAITLAALLAARYYSTVPSGNWWIDLTWSQPYSSHLLLQHLMMLGHYDSTRLNTAIWTLVIEMRVSLVFPLIVWASAKVKPWLALVICFLGTISLAYIAERSGRQAICGTLFYSFFFLAGSLLRRNYSGFHAVLSGAKWRTAAVALVGALCYQAGDLIPFTRTGVSPILGAYLQDWVLGFGAVLILMAATTSYRLRHLLHGRVALWCGARSYSIYLLHGTVLFVLIRRFRIETKPWELVGLFLLLVFVLSEMFYRAVEVPALTLGRKLGRRTVANGLPEASVFHAIPSN